MHAEAESSRGRRTLTCRGFLARAGTTGLVLAGGAVWRPGPGGGPGLRRRPARLLGAQVGDVSAHQAMLWAATDRPARMVVEYATSESFNVRRVAGPAALPESGLAAKVGLTDLPSGEAPSAG